MKKMETDLMFQMYENEKSKQRQDKLEDVAKNNLKLAVVLHLEIILIFYLT